LTNKSARNPPNRRAQSGTNQRSSGATSESGRTSVVSGLLVRPIDALLAICCLLVGGLSVRGIGKRSRLVEASTASKKED